MGPTASSFLLSWPILQRMQEIAGWLEPSEADLLLAASARAVVSFPGAALVEIGSYCGRSTVVLGGAVAALGSAAHVFAIDPHEGVVGAMDQSIHTGQPTLEAFQANIAAAGLTDIVRTLRQRSTDVGWADPIALLFVDGLHDYGSVSADYQHFEKYIVPGGFIAFHDYAPYYDGVMRFVDELIDSARVEKIAQVGSMVVVQKRDVARDFHDLYWNSGTWRWTFWQGIPTLKCPLDLWVYQELLWLLKPRLIIELGTFAGGTASFLANMQDLYARDMDARVVTVDILDDNELAVHVADYHTRAPFEVRIRPRHPRIRYIHGNSVSPRVVEHVKRIAEGVTPIMVIADSDHSFEHTYQELVQYHQLVTPGSWFIMEDTDGPGPRQAVDCFLQEHPEFSEDATCEKFHMTFNPRGYLRRS